MLTPAAACFGAGPGQKGQPSLWTSRLLLALEGAMVRSKCHDLRPAASWSPASSVEDQQTGLPASQAEKLQK